MNHKTYQWKTRDNKKLFAHCWKPEKEAGYTILMIHGLGEHGGRYERWAGLFVEKGYNFLTFDLRGHGKSSGKRGYARSIDVLLDDIDLAIRKVKRLFKESNIILYGHSMGGNLVLNHVIRRNYPVKALIVTSPWLRLKKEPSPALISIVSFLRKILPGVAIRNGIKAEQISHDPEVIKNYSADSLNHDKITFRLFHEMYNSGYHALRNVYKINYPFLLMHGSEDSITSAKTSENYVMNTTSRTRLKIWEGQYHELHNELIYKEVFDYIANWLEEHKMK